MFTDENKISDLINDIVIKITELDELNEEDSTDDDFAQIGVEEENSSENQKNLEEGIHEDFWSCFENIKEDKGAENSETR